MTRRFLFLVVAVSAALIGAAPSVRAQVAPSISVAPTRPGVAEPVTITVGGCPTEPVIEYTISDTATILEATATGTTGEWKAAVVAGQIDGSISASCGPVDFDAVTIDVENPMIGFQPQGSTLETPMPPVTVYGTDCSSGGRAFVGVTVDGRPYPERPASPIDDEGDWSAPVGSYPAGSTVKVSATCGDVAYKSLVFVVADETSTTSTTSATTSTMRVEMPAVPPATPARAQGATARYTG